MRSLQASLAAVCLTMLTLGVFSPAVAAGEPTTQPTLVAYDLAGVEVGRGAFEVRFAKGLEGYSANGFTTIPYANIVSILPLPKNQYLCITETDGTVTRLQCIQTLELIQPNGRRMMLDFRRLKVARTAYSDECSAE